MPVNGERCTPIEVQRGRNRSFHYFNVIQLEKTLAIFWKNNFVLKYIGGLS